MGLLKARDFSFVSVFVSSNWYFYKPLFVISWVSRRQKSIECCRATSERERERCEFCWLTDHKINKSTDLVTGKRMGHFKIVCVNDRWPMTNLIPAMPQLLALTLCHNYWHSHYATITDTHTMPQLLALTLCHNYWHSHYATITDTHTMPQLLTLTLCHNYSVVQS